MQHHFDILIAQKFGVNVAIFLENIAFWTLRNNANKKNFYDGRYWTYNSQEAFIKLFPYWTRQNLRTVIKQAIDQELIITGNYNETPYDRTHWYALTDKGIELFPTLQTLGWNQPIIGMDPSSSLVRINQPIPDNKPNTKPDIKDPTPKKRKSETTIPDLFIINDTHKNLAGKIQRCVDELFDSFKDHALQNDRRCRDWDAAFRNWIRKSPTFDGKTVKKENSYQKPINPNELRQTAKFFDDPEHPDNLRKKSHGSEISGNNTERAYSAKAAIDLLPTFGMGEVLQPRRN